MDDYDPACPTEDDIQFAELDLSQVPLPPSFPRDDEGTSRGTTSVSPVPPSEIGREDSQKSKKKKKKRRKHEGARSLADEDDKEDYYSQELTTILQVPGPTLPHEGSVETPVEEPVLAAEAEIVSDVDLTAQDPPLVAQDPPLVVQDPPLEELYPTLAAQDPPLVAQDPPLLAQDPLLVAQDPPLAALDPPLVAQDAPSTAPTLSVNQEPMVTSSVPAAVTSSVPPSKPAKLHFKLTQDPSGGKAKVSFQLKKSLKSAFHATEDNEEEGENVVNEVKDIVEKSAAGEYIPTRFKVSKKHEMFRPSLVEPSITVVFNSSLIGVGGTSNINTTTAQNVDTNILPVSKSHDSAVPLDVESAATTIRDFRKDRSTQFGRETRNSRMEEEEMKNKEAIDSQRGLRRSERRDRKSENSTSGKDDNSRSTRRSSRGSDRDSERYGSSRASYSRRDRDEDRQKEKGDKNIKTEDSESDDRRRSARFRKNESGSKGEEKESSDGKHDDRDGRSGSHRKSTRLEQNSSPYSTGGRRTRNSHRRSRSLSRERDNTTLPPTENAVKSIIPEQFADSEISTSADAASKDDALSQNANLNSNINEFTPEISNSEEQVLPSRNTEPVIEIESVMEISDVISEETAEKQPHIQKIVIRRTVDSTDFEIAKGDQADNINFDCSATENVIVSQEKQMERKDLSLCESDKEIVDASEKDKNITGSVDEKRLCEGDMVDVLEKENSELSIVDEKRVNDTLEIEQSDVSREGENMMSDKTVDMSQKEKGDHFEKEKGDCFEKEKGDHSEKEKGDHFEKEKGDHFEKEKGDHFEKEKGDHFEKEKGDHFEKENGDHSEKEKRLFNKTVDVLKIEKSDISKLNETMLSDKKNVHEKDRSGHSRAKEKSLSDKTVEEKDKSGTSRRDEKSLSDKTVEEKDKSGISRRDEKSLSDKTVEDKSGISRRDEKSLSDKTDAFEKEKTGFSGEDRKRFYDVEAFEKRKARATRGDEKRLSDKTDTSEKGKNVISRVNEKRLFDKHDSLERGKSGYSGEDEKRFYDDKAVDVFEKGKGRVMRGDEKRLSENTDVFEKGKGRVTRGDDKRLSERTDVFAKDKSGFSADDKKRLNDKHDSLEKGKTDFSGDDENRFYDDKAVDAFEKGKSRVMRGDEKRLSERTDVFEKGKSGFSADDKKRFYDDKAVDAFEKGKGRVSRGDEKRLSNKADDLEKGKSGFSGNDRKRFYDDDKAVDSYEKGKGRTTRGDEKRLSDKIEDVSEKGKSRVTRGDEKGFSSKEKVRSYGQQTYTKAKGRHRSSSSEDEFGRRLTPVKKLVVQRLPEKSSNIQVTPLLPEQVLVDVSALPGKSKWEMDDEDEDEIQEESFARNEYPLLGKDLKSLDVTSQRWPYRSQTENIQRLRHRKTESSSNDDEKSHEHKRHKESKRDKTENNSKKNWKDDESIHSSKISEESEDSKGVSSRSRAIIDNSKIISYLREYSSKEDKTLKPRTEIDNSKLVTYLKEYSGKMTAESSLHEASLNEPDVPIEEDAVSKKKKGKKKTESSQSEGSSKRTEVSSSEEFDNQRNNSLHTDGAKKEHGNSGIKLYHTESSRVSKKDADDKTEQLEEHQSEASPARSSSHERSQKGKSPEKLLKEQDERSSLKEKRTRSSSSERSASKSSQRSRDKRERSGSTEKNRRKRRNRSGSTEQQDHSRSTERRRGKRRSKSRSPARRSRDRRNRSRSKSQEKKNDRRERSRSREKSYSYRSFRSPVRDSFGRTRRDNRDRRGRSRSNSYERSNDSRWRDTEDSHSKPFRKYSKSKSPDKKGSEKSPVSEPDSKGKSRADKLFRIKLEPASPVDLSSIPIPDEIPLPDEEVKPPTPADVLQDEPMKFSDDVKETISRESEVSNTNDNAEEAANKLISASDGSKVKTAAMAEQKSQNINPATLSSAKDRQMKFFITGDSKKLKPDVVPDVLDDGGNDNAADKDKKSSLIVSDSTLDESDKSELPLQKIMKSSEENVERNEDMEDEECVEHPRNAKAEKLPVSSNEANDPKIVDRHNKAEKIDFPQKVVSDSEKERAVSSSSQPQGLKFKYTPLWELEKDERKPAVEEIRKKIEGPCGLALDYGSDSSDSEDVEEDSNINTKELENVPEESSSDEQKDANELSAFEDTGQDKVLEIRDSAEGVTIEPNQQLNAEKEPVVKADEPCGKVATLAEVREDCTESIEMPPEENSSVPSEVGEAYSPSHPSMEDLEDLIDVATPSVSKDKSESSLKIENRSPSKLEGKTALNSASSGNNAESHELTVMGSVSSITGVVSNTATVSHQLPTIPQGTHMPLRAQDAAISPITLVTSLVGQSFLGLHMPFSHSTLLSPALSAPRPVPPPSVVIGTQLSNISFPPTTGGPKPVPPPSHLCSSLPQTTLAFSGTSLSASAPQVTSTWDTPAFQLQTQASFQLQTQASFQRAASVQGMNSQGLGVHGAFGFQGAIMPGLRDVIPLPGSLQEKPVGALLGHPTVPTLGTLPGSTLSSVAQSTPSSFATVVGLISSPQQMETVVDSSPSVKFRISRFNQGPPSTQAIPPPTVAIPPPSLALPTALGIPTPALANNQASVPLVSSLPSVQQHTTPTVSKSVDSRQTIIPSLSSQKIPHVAQDQPAITTHSKRPKISSILSQPKVEEPSVLEAISAAEVNLKPLTTASEGPSSVKSQLLSGHSIDLPLSIPESSDLSEKLQQLTSDSAAQVAKPKTVKSSDDSLHEHHQSSSEDAAIAGSVKSYDCVSKEDCSAELLSNKTSQSPAEDIKSSVNDSSSLAEGPTVEPVSSSVHSLGIDMEDIPLPGESLSFTESQASPSSIPPPLPGKTEPHLPPSSPPKLPPLPATVAGSKISSTLVLPSPKGQTLGSLLAERKKRFSQSPLAIGMLPVQITQSPLAAGPLPKLPPEPDASKSSTVPPKKIASNPGATDTKSTLQLSFAATQKKPQVEKEEPKSISKVHFVFKNKAVVQKTLISAFDDDGSDDSGGENQATSSEPSHFESTILSVIREDKAEAQNSSLLTLPQKIIPSAVMTDTEKQVLVRDKEATPRDYNVGLVQRSKIVSLTDIEAFPVQVITSTRKEEVTPASSWPEFTVGKKEKGDDERDRDGRSISYDREDKSRKKRFSRERDDGRDERKRRSRYEGEEGKKINTRKKDDRRSDDDEYDIKIRIKKEKEDYIDRPSSGQDDRDGSLQRNRHYDDEDDRRRGRDVKDNDSYKRRSRFDDDKDYRRGKRDAKEDKYSRRRSGDEREEDYHRRKYDDDNRRVRSFERERSRERSHERERSGGKLSGKRSHRSRDISHSRSRSRSPSRRRDRGRDRSRDRYDRDKSRSHSRERSSGSSSRRKDLKSFKEELLEELTKPSGKVDPKDDLFKAAAISCTTQSYSCGYQADPVYSSSTESAYPQPHHSSEVASGYQGQDPHHAAPYPPPYDHQQYGPQWQNQPAQNVYNQILPPQHQDIPNQYPPIPPEQAAAPQPYPFQTMNSHYPHSNYPSNQPLPETYHPIPNIMHQQIPQMQHPASGPQLPHFRMDQHGQIIPPIFPNTQHQMSQHQISQHQINQHQISQHQITQHQITPIYSPAGPPNHFQPPPFTQEPIPSFTSSHFGPRPRTPLLPNPVRTPLLRSPLISHNIVEIPNFGSPKFSSPEVISSPSSQNQSDIRQSKKFKFGTLEEGTFSPVCKSSLATSSSPTVGSPSTSTLTTSEENYKNPVVADVLFGLSSIPEPSFETSLLAESEFDSTEVQDAKKSSKVSISKKKNSLEVNEPTVSSSGVEDSTGDTGSDSGTDSSSQRPLKVKSRWRRNSEAEAVVDTSTPLPPIVKPALSQISTPSDTPDSSPKERRRTRSRSAAEEFSSLAAQITETPPPPPPPRKRIKLEQEAAGVSEEQEAEVSADPQEDESKVQEIEVQDLASLMARPDFPKFEIITENIHLTERKRSKSMKRMLCDCTTSRDERSKGLTACGSDCLNRMLMIECNSRCPCGEYCTNKRFQKKQYSQTAPFKAGDKGWGLIAEEDMEEKGTFIMEYVGELLDYEEFVRRTRQYSRSGLVHHYFMALNADEVVDATLKGSISRFINHSCDPNCETQKWTVNGELRVGFFTRKSIKKGEELTFDYQFEHYGEAQKCYCGAENCRGFIGLVKSPTRNNRRKEKKKREIFKDELLEEDIAKLSLLDGMRNKNHVLDLCRLMVRAEKVQHRMAILKILQDTAESACLRLFLDYHGLPLLWSWMADIGTTDYSAQTQELKLLMLSVLKSLPITNKTALKESKIPDMVDRWAVAAVVAARKPPPPPPPASTTIAQIALTAKSIDNMVSRTTLADNEAVAVTERTASVEESGSMEEDAEKASTAEPEATTSSESSPPASPSPLLPPLLSTITPVSILASAKDSKDAKRKRRVTFAEIPIESAFSPEPLDAEENDDISSSTQSSGDKEILEDLRALIESGVSSGNDGQLSAPDVPGEAAASGDNRFGIDGGKMLNFDLKSDENLSGDVADSTSQKYNFDNGGSSGTASDADNSDTETLIKDPLASLAAECVSLWSTLKEVFKIPKRERVEERKRTERELDVLSKKDLEASDPFAKWKRSKVMRLSKKKVLEDDDRKLGAPKMSKEERRQLFEAQVKAEDEMAAQAYAEEYQRQQEEYILHHQRLLEDPQYFYFHQGDQNYAGMDPSMTPSEGLTDPVTGQPLSSETLIDPHTGQPVLDPNTGQHAIDPNTGQPIIDQNTGRPLVLHASQIDPNTGQPMVHTHHIDPQTGQQIHHMDPHTGQLVDSITSQLLHQIDPVTGQPLLQIDQMSGHPHHIDPVTRQPIASQIDPTMGQPHQHQMDPITHPHIQSIHVHFDPHLGQPLQHPHPVHSQTAVSNFQQQPQAQHLSGTAQNQTLLDVDFEEEVPPPPSPPTVPVTKLPANWKTAKDSEGRVYYYHAFTRQTQWEMPCWDDNDDDSDDMDLDPNPVDEVIKAKKKTTTAAADTSSEVARKIKDQFRSKMSNFVVTYLNPYRKQDCKIGRIVSTDDFKHLARKLTHHVMSKELKHCRHVEDLEVNENVKAKAKDYVRKYMSKFGSTFKKTSSPHPDDSSI